MLYDVIIDSLTNEKCYTHFSGVKVRGPTVQSDQLNDSDVTTYRIASAWSLSSDHNFKLCSLHVIWCYNRQFNQRKVQYTLLRRQGQRSDWAVTN